MSSKTRSCSTYSSGNGFIMNEMSRWDSGCCSILLTMLFQITNIWWKLSMSRLWLGITNQWRSRWLLLKSMCKSHWSFVSLRFLGLLGKTKCLAYWADQTRLLIFFKFFCASKWVIYFHLLSIAHMSRKFCWWAWLLWLLSSLIEILGKLCNMWSDIQRRSWTFSTYSCSVSTDSNSISQIL